MMDWCGMCKKSEETIDYLLPHYEVARALWVLIYRLFGLEWIITKERRTC
jgi:hypothetical protein